MKVDAILLGMHRLSLPRRAGPAGHVVVEFAEEAVPLSRVRESLGMPVDAPRIVFLMGQPIDDDAMLHDGDAVTFVSPVAGG